MSQEQKFLNKEKSMAINKARESFRSEIEKIKADAHEVHIFDKFILANFHLLSNIFSNRFQEKQEEINKYKRLLKEAEEDIDRLKVEMFKSNDKEKEFIISLEKLEKNLIKEMNEEQRKLSTLVPGLMPKLVNSSKYYFN